MKLIQSILVISALLFFINCTAWPALIPPPAGKTKTAVYPIPLPATSTTAPVRITGPAPAGWSRGRRNPCGYFSGEGNGERLWPAGCAC